MAVFHLYVRARKVGIFSPKVGIGAKKIDFSLIIKSSWDRIITVDKQVKEMYLD